MSLLGLLDNLSVTTQCEIEVNMEWPGDSHWEKEGIGILWYEKQ